ncbi:MAG: transcriptional regulator [Cyanothece sp. SIO1E1]|nr:transcriptional regulator [Cyanothece sp. SIO1E1]
MKRDRFELLSAYLDGEVTADERRQVEGWLANDPVVQRLYERLLLIRRGLQTMPIPTPQRPVEETVQQVVDRLDRRHQLKLVWGGGAIAALLIAAFSGALPTRLGFPQFNLARPNSGSTSEPLGSPEFELSDSLPDALKIDLDRPVISIPKAPVADPGFSTEDSLYESNVDVQ